jgi:DNA-directed RNA polymerase subunit RPC12/RpoP
MNDTRSVYICDRCSKQFRNWRRREVVEVISPTPYCPRCTSKCRLLEREKIGTKKGPDTLESIVQHAISKAAIQSRLFPPVRRKSPPCPMPEGHETNNNLEAEM